MVQKTEILRTAIDTFGNLGIKRVSIDDLCYNLSISKKTFLQHYSEKHVLINDFLEAEFAAIFDGYARLKETAQSPLELMIRFNQFLMETLQSKNPAVLDDLRQFYPENLVVLHRLRTQLIDMFVDILKDGIKEGYFRKEIDPKSLAEMRVAQLESILLPLERRQKYPENYHKQLLEHYIYGIAGFLGMGRIPEPHVN